MLRKFKFSALENSVSVTSLFIEIVKCGLSFVKYLKTQAVVPKNVTQLGNLETSGKVNDGF